jgi:hypothetical protein
MIGETNLGGVYLPTLLVLAVLALAVTGVVTRVMALLGGYRMVAYRALADIAIFVLVLGVLVRLTEPAGMH